jgi:hypothetical protein
VNLRLDFRGGGIVRNHGTLSFSLKMSQFQHIYRKTTPLSSFVFGDTPDKILMCVGRSQGVAVTKG